jgi:hypothetical protein
MALEIIGPGFGRTGTSSLKTALEHLGYGPAHHMFEVRDNAAQLPYWQALARGERVNWDAVFDAYRSQVDWPGARYWRELAAHYPDAKIVLTVRDPDEWYDSIQRTILKLLSDRAAIGDPHVRGVIEMAYSIVDVGEFGGRLADRNYAISVFNQHIADVQAAFSGARLLTFDVEQGWAPLCRFLGREIPSISFPRLNSSKQFVNEEWAPEPAPVV